MSGEDRLDSRPAFEEDGPAVPVGLETETEPEAKDAAESWMHRDDEFLREEDREYVLRDEGRSWRAWVSPVLFGAILAVLVGDAIVVGAAMGLESAHPIAILVSVPLAGPVVASILAETGLGGLVLLKAMAAILLLLLPGVTDSARQTVRAGTTAVVAIGLLIVVSNAWAVFVAVG